MKLYRVVSKSHGGSSQISEPLVFGYTPDYGKPLTNYVIEEKSKKTELKSVEIKENNNSWTAFLFVIFLLILLTVIGNIIVLTRN